MATRLCIYALCLLMASTVIAGDKAHKQVLYALEQPFLAPDFELKGEDGNSYRMSNYRGRLVVLTFWATWCPPCRYELPSMERAWQKLRKQDIMFIGVNVGEDEDAIFKFMGDYPMSFPLPIDHDSSVVKKYRVIGLPTTYVVNSEGMVIYRAVGSREWDDPQILEVLRTLQRNGYK